MQIRYAFVDAFTEGPLAGNPVAIVPHAETLDEPTMRRIAGEFDQVAATFILPPKNDFECPALTCRSPAHAYGPPNGLAVQLGDRNSRQGARAVPSLSYVLNGTPIWNKEFIANPVERILEGEEPPTGGLTWDGRFNTLHEQATFPLAPNEMANAGPKETGSYANDLRRQFGPDILDDSPGPMPRRSLRSSASSWRTLASIHTAANTTTTSMEK
jgi:Phenazine biosynthesis-like protein/Di-haem cytochrome c peroxidase